MLCNRFVICNFPRRRKHPRSSSQSRYAGPVPATLRMPSPISKDTGSSLPRAKTWGWAQCRPYAPLIWHRAPTSTGSQTSWRKRTKWLVSPVKTSRPTGQPTENTTPDCQTMDSVLHQHAQNNTKPHCWLLENANIRPCFLISAVDAFAVTSSHLIHASRGSRLDTRCSLRFNKLCV